MTNSSEITLKNHGNLSKEVGPPMNTGVENLVRQWEEALSRCEYAGELVIPEDDLATLAARIHQNLFRIHRTDTTKAALLVLAVNCMYYKHDEHGFWIHFCLLLDVSNNSQTQSWLGEIIESQLKHFGFLEQSRSGPFRYISPLREQTGITRQEIPRFADVLRDLSSRYGWSGILVLTRESFSSYVIHHLQSGHLCQFLQNESGWHFTIDVARSISQYNRRILSLSDLNNLPGYRKYFFKELIEALGSPPHESARGASKPSRPRLVFMPEFRQIMLLFDQEAVHNGAYEFLEHGVTKTLIAYSENMISESICGRVRDSDDQWHDWVITGWDPQCRPVGLFHVDRGFIKDHREIIPGQYYCIAKPENAPPLEIRRSYYGQVDLPIVELDFDAWLIVLGPSVDLSWAGFDTGEIAKREELIAWGSGGTLLEGAVDIEKAFIGSLPTVCISNVSLFHSNTIALFVDYGNGARRICIGPDDDQVSIDVPVSSRGRIWVEPISRRREFSGLDSLDELPFVVLPVCKIRWPQGLFSPKDEPLIAFESQSTDVRLALSDAVCKEVDGCRWNVNPGIEVVQGRVIYKNLTVNVAKQVFRASICRTLECETQFFSHEDFESDSAFLVTGVAGTDVVVSLFDGDKHTNVLGLGTFNDAGTYKCSAMAFRDPIGNFPHLVGSFCVNHIDIAVETGSFFIDVSRVLNFISTGTLDKELPWFRILPSGIKLLIESLMAVRHEAQQKITIPSHTSCPDPLLAYAKLIAVFSSVYDDTELIYRNGMGIDLISELEYYNPAAAAARRWYIRAKLYSASGKNVRNHAQELLYEYDCLTWEPPISRWKSTLEGLLTDLKSETEIIPFVAEWKADVRCGYGPPPISKITKKKYGRELKDAWLTYAAGNFKGAIASAKYLISIASSPILDLAVILLQICWMRLAYFSSQPEIRIDSSNNELRKIVEVMTQIVSSPEEIASISNDETEILRSFTRTLPLTKEDVAIFEMIASGEPTLQTDEVNDWLLSYFRLCLSQKIDDNEETIGFARELYRLRGEIPASPDKRSIIGCLEKYL